MINGEILINNHKLMINLDKEVLKNNIEEMINRLIKK
jgi:hypothetical protein